MSQEELAAIAEEARQYADKELYKLFGDDVETGEKGGSDGRV